MQEDKNKIKLSIIYILLFVIFILLLVGVMYAIRNYNSDDIFTIENFDSTVTIASDQLDAISQPNPGLPLTLDSLPKTSNTIEDINVKTLKKLFQTTQKSLLLLVKDDCSYCSQYEPIITKVLEDNELNAYRINISDLSDKEMQEMINYIDYDGTPTTYVIKDGVAKHTITGIVDENTLNAFIDYFYTRDN